MMTTIYLPPVSNATITLNFKIAVHKPLVSHHMLHHSQHNAGMSSALNSRFKIGNSVQPITLVLNFLITNISDTQIQPVLYINDTEVSKVKGMICSSTKNVQYVLIQNSQNEGFRHIMLWAK